MDLRNAPDSPIAVLNKYAAATIQSDGNLTPHGEAYATGATRLFGYQAENGVIFVALDFQTLHALHRAWKDNDAVEALVLIEDLLGFEENDYPWEYR